MDKENEIFIKNSVLPNIFFPVEGTDLMCFPGISYNWSVLLLRIWFMADRERELRQSML